MRKIIWSRSQLISAFRLDSTSGLEAFQVPKRRGTPQFALNAAHCAQKAAPLTRQEPHCVEGKSLINHVRRRRRTPPRHVL
jgi:hypothetical protein